MSHLLHALEDGEHLAALLLAPALAALQLVHHLALRRTMSGGGEQKANDEQVARALSRKEPSAGRALDF